jgi:hypothetical protein
VCRTLNVSQPRTRVVRTNPTSDDEPWSFVVVDGLSFFCIDALVEKYTVFRFLPATVAL